MIDNNEKRKIKKDIMNIRVYNNRENILKKESLLYDPCKHHANTSLLYSTKTVLDEIRILLRISNTNLYQLFQEKDTENSGILPFLEFKN